MRLLWLKVAAALAGIWLIVGGVVWWVHSRQPTPESLGAYVAAHPVDGRSPAQRDKVLQTVVELLNDLQYEQRREVRLGKRLDSFFKSLTPEEQARFLDLTLPTGFKQMMEAFNKMEPEKRRAMVQKSLEQMKTRGAPEAQPDTSDPHVRKMIEQGMQSFYSDATTETKLDLAPLIEQIQKNLQGLGP